MDARRRALWLAAAGLLVFVVLLVLVATGAADGVDVAVASWARRHRAGGPLLAAQVITDVLSPGVDAMVLLIGAALISRRDQSWRPLRVAVVVLLLLAVTVLALKHAVDRPLPRATDTRHGLAFPSGHTAATLVGLGTLASFVAARRPDLASSLRAAVLSLTLLVAAALVYARYHWLTDTLGSMALGVAAIGLLTWSGEARRCRRPRVPATTRR